MTESSGGGWSEVVGGSRDPGPSELPGGYELRDTLGAGGMGEVVRAFDPRLHRDVALKRVKQTARSPELRARLLREARITATLDHPGIVPVLDVGELDDGRLFYTMRLVAGRTLDQIGDLPLARRLRHVLDAVQAVAYAHANDVLHRDLKPQNILVGAFGETLVVDWGLARRVHSTLDDSTGPDIRTGSAVAPASGADTPIDSGLTPGLTRMGVVLGTEQWMSPEQARGEPLGPTTDVYALGAVLVEAITGRRGDWTTLAGGIEDRKLQAIARRCLSESPLDRYPSAGSMAEDLAAWLDGDRVSAYRYTWRDHVAMWVDRHRNALTGLTLVVAAGATGLSVAGGLALQERSRAVAAEADAVEQRDRANNQLARSMAREAVQSGANGDWGRSRLLAAQSLTLGQTVDEDPRARGVWMADLGFQPDLHVVDPGCPDAEPTPLGWTCSAHIREATHTVSAGEQHAWVVGRKGFAIVSATGEDLHRVTDTPVGPVSVNDHVGGFVSGRFLQTLTRDGIARDRRICDDASAHHPSHMTRDGVLIFACRDGRLGRFDGDEVEMQPLPDAPRDIFGFATTDTHVFLATKDRYEARRNDDLALDFAFPVSAGAPQRIEVEQRGRWALLHAAAPGPVLYDLEQRREAWRLPATWLAALSPDGRLRLLTDRGPTELDVSDLRAPGVGHYNMGLADIAVSPDRRRVALARGDGIVTIWQGGRLEASLPHPGPKPTVARALAWLEAEDTLAVSRMWSSTRDYHQLEPGVWTPRGEQGRPCRRLLLHRTGRACFSFTHVGAALQQSDDPGFGASLGASLDGSATPRLVDAHHTDGLADWMVEIGEGGRVLLYGPDGVPHHGFSVQGGRFVAITADGTRVAVVLDGAVQVHADDGTLQLDLPVGTPLEDVAWSLDGRWLAAGARDGRTFVWDADGVLRAELGLHTDQVSAILFTEDALWTGSWDGFARRWSLSALEETPTPSDVARRWALADPDAGDRFRAEGGPAAPTGTPAPAATAP